MSYLTANMKMIAECAEKIAHLGEKLFNETEMKTTKEGWTTEFPCPDGYEFRDENGNVIEAKKIVLEKKKKEYPRTINECGYILQDATGDEVGWYAIDGWQFDLLEKMQMLLICRDAYWKLAGEEMGLKKPWRPDYVSGVDKFGICTYDGVVQKSNAVSHWERHANKILDFPTKEMRDAFYENFKDLIEECKELI